MTHFRPTSTLIVDIACGRSPVSRHRLTERYIMLQPKNIHGRAAAIYILCYYYWTSLCCPAVVAYITCC